MSADELSIRLSTRDELTGKLKDTRAAIKAAVDELAKLNKELDSETGKRAYDDQRRSLSELSLEEKRLRSEIGKNERAIKDFGTEGKTAADKVAAATATATTSQDRFEQATNRSRRALDRISARVDVLKSKIGKLNQTISGSALTTLARRGTMVVGAVGAASAAVGVKTMASLEQSQISFTTMLDGSKKKAKAMLSWLTQTAASTPFELTNLTQGMQRMLAYGFHAKKAKDALLTIGDAASATGMGAEGIDRITLAIGQMNAKQKITAQEMNQLAETGIPAYRMLADKLNMTVPDLQELMSKPGGGNAVFEQAGGVSALLDAMKNGTKHVKGYGGAMEEQSKTLSGLWSTLKDTFSLGMADMLKPYRKDIKGAVRSLIDGLGGAFKTIGKIIEKVRPTLTRVFDFISKNRGPILAAAAAIGVMSAAMAILNAVMALNPITLIVIAIGVLIGLLVAAYNRYETFRVIVQKVFKEHIAIVKKFVNWFSKNAWPVIKAVIGAIISYVKLMARVWGKVIKTVIDLVRSLWEKMRPVFDKIGRTLKAVWDPFLSAAKTVFNAVSSAWNNTVGKLSWTVPDWVPLIAGNTISAPQLPMLWTGGPVHAGMKAIVGELGPELYVPDNGPAEVVGARGPEIRDFPVSGVILPHDWMPAAPVAQRSPQPVAAAAGGPLVSIGQINAASDIDVEARVLHAALRAQRIDRERR